MNTYRFIKYIGCGLLLLLCWGCNESFLDQEPYESSIVESRYFTNEEQVNTSTKVAYRYVDWDSWWQTQNWRFLSGEAASDNAWIGNTYQNTHASWDAIAHYTIDAGNDRAEGHWIMLYKSIGIWNSLIEKIEGSPIEEASKKQYIAELKFLRSWSYFALVRNWGGVPLVLKIYPPDQHIPRSTEEQVYAQIISDLSEIAAILPAKSDYPEADRFRASRGAALTLLAKIYLYTEDWVNAEATAKKVMDSGEYLLEGSFGDLWDYNYANGDESVFEIQFANSEAPELPYNAYVNPMNSRADGGWAYISVSSDLENAYKSEADSIRLQWTINRHGLPVAGDPNNPAFDGEPYASSKSGRYSRKRYIPIAERPANGRFAKNDIILRFADVILIHAEAAAMQMKTAEALDSYQKIRDRVDLSTDLTLTGWDLIRAIRKERRLELALEGDRLYDLRRWKDESGVPVINNVLGPKGSFVIYNTKVSTDPYETGNTTEPQNKGFNFDPAIHSLWPIPNSQIVSSEGAVTQNPGY